MEKKTAMFKQLVYKLFLILICVPWIFAQSTTCCENIKAELEQKLQAYRTLCSTDNNCEHDYIVLNVLVYTVVFLLSMLLLT